MPRVTNQNSEKGKSTSSLEKALISLEIRYRHLFESTKEGILILDAQTGIIVDVNPFLTELLGYSKDRFIEKTIWETGIFKDIIDNKEKLFEWQQKDYVRYEELPVETAEGHIINVEFICNVYLVNNHKEIQCHIRDINTHKPGDKELQNSEAQLYALLQSIPDLVWLKDAGGVYLACNPMFGRFFGAKETDIVGKTDYDFVDRELADFFREHDRKAMEAGKPTSNEEWLTFADDGHKIFSDTIKTPMYDANGDLIGVLGIGRDITERKRAEREIKKKNEQLIKLNAEKDKFFSIIAHDLKGPFNGFLNLTELMADSAEVFSPAEIIENSKLLNEAARSLYKLLENLLEWAQVQKGAINFTPKDSDLSKMVSQSIETIFQRALQKRISIINEIIDTQKVYADEKMISTVLRNLLSNAVKFTRTDGKTIIKSEWLNNDIIEVSVEDNGVGISENDIHKLFKIEEKVSSKGTEGESSTGLGLLLCKEFIEMHGGKIWVESEEGKGSKFKFTLHKSNLKS